MTTNRDGVRGRARRRRENKNNEKTGGDGERAKVGENEDGQIRSFWATQVYPSKCYCSRRTSMDVLFVRGFSRYIQIKPYIALHCIACVTVRFTLLVIV